MASEKSKVNKWRGFFRYESVLLRPSEVKGMTSKISKKAEKNTLKRCERFRDFLLFLKECKSETFNTFCDLLNNNGCEMFFECVFNAIHNKRVSPESQTLLKKSWLPIKNEIKYIAKRKSNFEKKKKLLKLLKNDANLLAESLLPILNSEIAKKTKR